MQEAIYASSATPSLLSSIRMPLASEVVADGVGAGEVAGLFGLGALGDQGVDVGVGEREVVDELGGGFVEAAFASAQSRAARVMAASWSSRTAKTPSKRVEDFEDVLDVFGAKRSVVGGGVGGADEIEDGGAGFGGVEVVGEGGGVVVLGFARLRRRCRDLSPSGKAVLDMRWWKVRRRSMALVDSVRPSKVKFIWLR